MNLRFAAFYVERCGTVVAIIDTGTSMFLSVVTAASAGAWLATDAHPRIWAAVIALAQVVTIAKKLLPWLRKSAEYGRCSLAYERIYCSMEAVWREIEASKDEAVYRKALAQLREKELKVETQYRELPTGEWAFITQWARRRVGEFVALNFPEHEQLQPQTSPAAAPATTATTACAAS